MSINYTLCLKRYLNQNAVWKQCTGHDEYGGAIYADQVEIAVRKVPMQKLITDSYGKQSVSKTTVLTHEDVGIDDLVDGCVVISVEWSVDRWGRNIARSAMLADT